jgi:cytochrome oxidase Cu insertion factor (SCO1/SenC/PrrC family)
MKNKALNISFVVIVISVVTFTSLKIWKSYTQLEKQVESTEELRYSDKSLISFLLNKELIENHCENQNLPDTTRLVDTSGNQIPLSDITKGKPTLFFTYSQSSCDDCVKMAIREIGKLQQTKQPLKICIVAYFENLRSQIIFANNLPIEDVEIYSFHKNVNMFGFNPELINYASFYLLDEDYNMDMVYIHEKTYPETTAMYLKMVMNKYNPNS